MIVKKLDVFENEHGEKWIILKIDNDYYISGEDIDWDFEKVEIDIFEYNFYIRLPENLILTTEESNHIIKKIKDSVIHEFWK